MLTPFLSNSYGIKPFIAKNIEVICNYNDIDSIKNIFKKIITIPIENEKGTLNNNKLYQIALKNNINVNKANNFNEALKKISSKEKKLIVCFGSLYNAGNILNKN